MRLVDEKQALPFVLALLIQQTALGLSARQASGDAGTATPGP
jgi:hypothetical protein